MCWTVQRISFVIRALRIRKPVYVLPHWVKQAATVVRYSYAFDKYLVINDKLSANAFNDLLLLILCTLDTVIILWPFLSLLPDIPLCFPLLLRRHLENCTIHMCMTSKYSLDKAHISLYTQVVLKRVFNVCTEYVLRTRKYVGNEYSAIFGIIKIVDVGKGFC